jgi:hypothetical protein
MRVRSQEIVTFPVTHSTSSLGPYFGHYPAKTPTGLVLILMSYGYKHVYTCQVLSFFLLLLFKKIISNYPLGRMLRFLVAEPDPSLRVTQTEAPAEFRVAR